MPNFWSVNGVACIAVGLEMAWLLPLLLPTIWEFGKIPNLRGYVEGMDS